MNLDIVDIILLLGISQGIFLSISIRLINNKNKYANNYLSLLLLIASLMLFCRFAAFRISQEWVWRFGILIDTSIFVFGPLIYVYSKRLVINTKEPYKLAWYHFILPSAHLVYYFWTLSFSLKHFNTMYFSGKLNWGFFLVQTFGIISLTFYWFKTFFVAKQYKNQEAKELSFTQTVYNYLRVILITFGICIVTWFISFISANFFGRILNFISYDILWISIPVFIYAIGYYSLKQPEIFRITPNNAKEADSNRLKPEQIRKLQKSLNYLMNEEKVYTNQDLTLKYLASRLDTSINDLSWLLNQVYHESFRDYINRYRIDAFLEEINQDKHKSHTILSLALDVGFNSKSTFNRVFKSRIGKTPKEYLKNRKVA